MHVIEYCINAYNFMAPWEFHLKFMTTQATEGIYVHSLLFGIIPKKKGQVRFNQTDSHGITEILLLL